MLPGSPPFTVLTVEFPDPEALEYRSVLGRGVSNRRRIDVSSSLDLRVTFWALKPARDGIERVQLGFIILDGGVPLLWPVPESAGMDDVLVVFEPYEPSMEAAGRHHIYIGDHWSTT